MNDPQRPPPKFRQRQRVYYPACSDGSSPAGTGRVEDVIPFNDGSGYCYSVIHDDGTALLVAFLEYELEAL